jgi:hypothetical protein
LGRHPDGGGRPTRGWEGNARNSFALRPEGLRKLEELSWGFLERSPGDIDLASSLPPKDADFLPSPGEGRESHNVT